jgi:hypothetical protein
VRVVEHEGGECDVFVLATMICVAEPGRHVCYG